MKRKQILIGLAIVLILALLPLLSAEAGRSRKLYLRWREVVPEGTGDPNMFGEATLDVNAGQAQFCYNLRVFIYYGTSEWPPTASAIHKAPFGENGPLVVDLNPPWGPLGQSTVSDCVSIDKDLAHDIQRNPEQYYLLISDSSYPEGAARAQLTK